MFKVRLMSGIVLLLIAFVTLTGGGDLLFATLLMISFIGMTELYALPGIKNRAPGIAGYVAAVCYYFLVRFGRDDLILPLIAAFLIVLLGIYVFSYPKYRSEQLMTAFFGLFYVAFMLSYIYRIRMSDKGIFLVWLVFLCSWGCDTCAYCVGMLIGKHKMTPKLSPKKSVEGAVGGVLGAAALGAIYALCINRFASGVRVGVPACAAVCAAGAVISQIGDLAASALKRNYDVKDYGNLIPGHGGILDRFDSVIVTAPIIYYMAKALL